MVAGLEGIPMPTVAAPKLHATIWQSATDEPVSASSFLPPPKCLVRAWHRIPVPAVARPCMIWKRTVGEPGTDSDSIQYALAMAELGSQGQGERKRARKAKHVPIWGDAQWDIRVEEPRDGTWDLVEARASVAAIQDEKEDVKEHATAHRPATFPEEKLRWVPRKRHNSRWPIEPISRTEPIMMGEIQPLVNFEVPTANIDSAAAQDSPQRATDKQMRRRSTRRLSRRVSFAHIEDVSGSKTPTARRISQVVATPTKSSPTKKVSASPQKAFTLLATPAKVQFRPSPHKARSPALRQSPIKAAQLSPASQTVEASEVDNSSLLSDSSVLVFEQPVPEAQAESAQETRRRVSLQNARRLERRSIGSRRSLDFGTAPQPAPNRRHSFMPRLSGTASLKSSSRRHTLDVVGESSTVVTEMEQDEETTTGFSSAETTENISEVVVDVCANLDIFGQKSGVTRRRKGRRASPRQGVNSHSDHDGDAVSSPQSAASRNSGDVDDSPLPIGLGITYSTEVAHGAGDSPDQAAVLELSFSMPTRDSDDADKDFWLDDGIGSMQCQQDTETIDDGEVHHDDMFAPHDPEGLSTIFEDEEASYAQSSPQQQPTTGEADNAYSSTSSPVRDDILSTESRSPSSATTGGADEPTACSPASESTSTGNLEQEEEQPDTVHEVMEQSFDFSMIDSDEVEQQNSSIRNTVVRLSTEQPEVTTEKSNMSPSSSASPRDEEPDSQQEHEQSDCYPSPPDDDDSIAASEDDCCRTIVVEDFPAHGEAAPARTESHESKQGDALDDSAVGTLSNGHIALAQVEVASSPAADVQAMDVFASTPPQAEVGAHAAMDGIDTVLETPPTKGFTPINSDRVSPPQQSPGVTYVDDEDQDEADDIQDEDMALALDYEPAVPINLDDETPQIDPSEPDTEPAAMQEDSETEMLRKFVTRVSANKSAKAAAAAALARRNLRPKRRSGSTGSTTSVTGSPIAKPSSSLSSEAAQRMMTASMSSSSPPRTRLPLGEKDANSPSPTKKRKAGAKSHGRTHSDDLFKGNPALYSAEISPPKSKRLRSRRRVEAESDTSSSSNQAYEQQPRSQGAADTSADSTAATGGVRRSTRSRSSRVQLKPPAPSANSIALSLIPVRLPGSSSMVLNAADTSGDKDMPTPVVVPRAAARTTAEEKDLAAVTRVNTRKNKGAAMPPKVVLSRQAEDPLGFKLRELKGVFDAREGRQEEAASADAQEEEEEEKGGAADGRKSRKGKGVRWASELVRFNTDFEVQSPKVVSVPLPPSRKGARATAALVQPPSEENADGYFPHFSPAAAGEEATSATAVEQQQQPALSVEEVVEEQRPEEGKQPGSETKPAPAPAPTRRTRQSRLQAPTPISKKMLAESTTAPAQPKVASASVVKMATRRTKIASLGMGVNGTPAPKRRTRT